MMDRKEPKQGYKKTPLGSIPEEWEVGTIGKLATKIGSGITPTGGEKVYQNSGIPFLRSQNVGWGALLLDDVAHISSEIHGTFKSTQLHINDVLLNITGASIGRTALVDERVAGGNVNQHVCIIRTLDSALQPEYLKAYLLSSTGQGLIDSYQAGGNRQGLNFEQIRSLPIPLPPLPEQRAIAEVLGCWDRGIAALGALIAQKQARKKWLMQVLLTGKRRLPGFEGAWGTVRLGEVFEERVEIGRGDLRLLSISSSLGVVDRDSMEKRDSSNEDKSKYRRIARGDIGYNTMRLWQGVASLSTLEGIVSPAYTIIIPKDSIDGEYMSYLFKTQSMINKFYMHSQGLVDDTRNCKYPHFAEIKVAIPPKREQLQIAKVINSSDQEIRLLETQLASLKVQKKGLMQVLLTGRKRISKIKES